MLNIQGSDESIDIVANERAILNQWQSTPLITEHSEKPAYTICGYPNADPFTLSHTKLITSIIKDVLLRTAQQNGLKPIVIDSVKEDAVQKFEDMQRTLERLGCVKTIPRQIEKDCPMHSCAIQEVYRKLCHMNMIYRMQKIMPYCIQCRAPVSNFEWNVRRSTRLIPYAHVMFPLKNRSNVKILVAITSAWELAVNVALCVNPSAQYVEIWDKSSNEVYLIAENSMRNIFPADAVDDAIEILYTYRGENLRGFEYTPVFDYFSNATDWTGWFRIICDEIVDSFEGTGIVLLAPHLVKEHFQLCTRENIFPTHQLNASRPLDEQGKFSEPISDLMGCNVFDCEKALIMLAKAKGRLKVTDARLREVPVCLRCNTRLIEKPVLSQFINVRNGIEKVRQYAAQTTWCPDFIWQFKLGEWLENSDDWAISRFDGDGIPFPMAANVPSNVAELNTLSPNSVAPVHTEVFHSTFENAAAVIAEYHGLDKGNGRRTIECIAENCEEAYPWFYTLLVLSSLVIDNFLVENVIVTDMVLKELEDDMEVRRGTSPPVYNLLSKYGSDAYRMYCMNSIIKNESRLSLMEIELNLLCLDVIKPLYSVLHHFHGDRNQSNRLYSFNTEYLRGNEKNPLDKWILSLYGQLETGIQNDMSNYHLTEVTPKLVDFMEELNKWYIHLNQNQNSPGFKDILLYVLSNLSHLIWPIVPFVSEHVSQALMRYQSDNSRADVLCKNICVHLPELEMAIEQMKAVIDLARSIRQRKRIPVAHALAEIVIINKDNAVLENIIALKSYILAELNVVQLTTGCCTKPYKMRLKAKPIFARLHNRSDYKALAKYIRKMSDKHIQKRLLDSNFCNESQITMGDISINYVQKGSCAWNYFEARTSGNFVVLLNTQLADANVQRICAANELIGYINDMRNMVQYRRYNYLRIFYGTLQYSSDKVAITTLQSIIDEHLAMIEGAIQTEFRPMQNEYSWKPLIEDEFIVLGVKLKIHICRPS